MSKITVLYNYFGGTSFAESCKLFKALGIFSFDFGPVHSEGFYTKPFNQEHSNTPYSIQKPILRKIIEMVAQQKAVKDHKLVILLKKHSEIVKFIIDLRLK